MILAKKAYHIQTQDHDTKQWYFIGRIYDTPREATHYINHYLKRVHRLNRFRLLIAVTHYTVITHV